MKQIHLQIANAEKSLARLIKDFTNISVNMHRMNSRQVDLCSTLTNLAAFESPTFSRSIKGVCKHLDETVIALKDHTTVLQTKVVPILADNVDSCEFVRQYLEKCSVARKAHVKTNTIKPNTLANFEMAQQIDELITKMEDFERAKIDRLHTCFRTYIHSSLAYHVKSVESLTKAYKALSFINTKDHLDYFKRNVFPTPEKVRLDFVRWNSLHSLADKNCSHK